MDGFLMIPTRFPLSLQQPENWDFREADTKEGTHVIHSYPAMMIPPVARGLIARLRKIKPEAQSLLDPFCGAGTVLVEGARQGLIAWGNDLNPLAVRIASARTTPIAEEVLSRELNRLDTQLTPCALSGCRGTIPEFAGRDFWFKPEVTHALAFIRAQIAAQLTNAHIRTLAEMAFSETVRLASNTRNGEFKLYRLPAAKLAAFHPDVLGLFRQTMRRYQEGLRTFNIDLQNAPALPRIVREDARSLTSIPDHFFDLMVSSPPYGDSRTTVAYGQFSRLSLEWLGFSPEQARTVDRQLLGGRPGSDPTLAIPSLAVQQGIHAIASHDPVRARQVYLFYHDLDQAIEAITRKLKPGALCAWVVANRTVKRIVLPTHAIIRELSLAHGYEWLEDLTRNIPNKRMPLSNSPTNVQGETGATMTQEHMVILRYRG